MYKVGQILGYVTERSDELERSIRVTVVDVIFNQFDDETIDKYLVDFRYDETERQVDSLYWYPMIYSTWQEFVNSASYQVEEPLANTFMITTPVGDIVVVKDDCEDYPSVCIDLHDKKGEEIPLVTVEYNNDKGLRAIVWGDPDQEDYTHSINIIESLSA